MMSVRRLLVHRLLVALVREGDLHPDGRWRRRHRLTDLTVCHHVVQVIHLTFRQLLLLLLLLLVLWLMLLLQLWVLLLDLLLLLLLPCVVHFSS